MPWSKRQINGLKNMQKRRAAKPGGHKGPYRGFDFRGGLNSPSKKRHEDEPTALNRCDTTHSHVSSTMLMKFNNHRSSLLPIEKRWYAVLRLIWLRMANNGRAPRKAAERIARAIGKSVRSLNKMAQMALLGHSLARRSGSGRPRLGTAEQMKKWCLAKHRECTRKWTTRSMARAMKKEWNGVRSVGTVYRLARMCHFKLTKPRLLPILSSDHMTKRKQFAQELTSAQDNPLDDPDTVFVMIDEKWFVRNRHGPVWMAPDEVRPAEFLRNKQHETKVMFLGALARPRPSHGFAGGIGLWPIGTIERAVRSSNLRPAGARVFVPTEMNKEKTIEMVKRDVIPEILRQTGKWAKKIVLVMDNAGGHGGGRGDMTKTTLRQLNEWGERLPESLMAMCENKGLTLKFIAQPPHSPDMNILDAGAWWSLQVAVDAVNDSTNKAPTEIDVHDAVITAWKTWVDDDKIEKLFADVLMNCCEIIRTRGGNLYQQPHHKRSQ